MRFRRLALAALALLLLTSTASASERQQIWVANYATGGSQTFNLFRAFLDTGDSTYTASLGAQTLAIAGWRDSLYVGTTGGLARTDLAGTPLESRTDCASMPALAVWDRALYGMCTGMDPRLVRIALNADGSLGAMATWARPANWVSKIAIANGYLYALEDYPSPTGVARIPLMNPAQMQEAWYPTAHIGALAVLGGNLFVSGGNSLYRTSADAPSDATATQLTTGFAFGRISGLAARSTTLYISNSDISNEVSSPTAVYTQSIPVPTTPQTFANWTRPSANHFEPTAIYVGNQEQTWTVDTTDRALSAGAFAAPISASSGLTATITTTTPTVCTTSGTTVTPIAAGTCTISAEQSGNEAYLAAPTGTVSIAITAPKNATATFAKPKLIGSSIVTSITVPGPGTITQSGTVAGARKSKTTTICTTKATAKKVGPVTLTCRLNKAGLARRKRGALAVTLTTVYTPTGGTAQRTTQKVKVARAKRG